MGGRFNRVSRFGRDGRDLVEITAEHLHPAGGLPPVEVLVDGVVAVLGERQAEKDHRRLEQPLHRQHGADRASFAHEGRLLAERRAHRRRGRLVVRAADRRQIRLERRLVGDHRVGELLLHEALDQLEDLGRLLIGDQARRQLGLGAVGDDRLDSGAGVAAHQPVHLERRRGDERRQRVEIVAHRAEAAELVRGGEAPAREAGAPEGLLLGGRDLADAPRKTRGSSPCRCARRTSRR